MAPVSAPPPASMTKPPAVPPSANPVTSAIVVIIAAIAAIAILKIPQLAVPWAQGYDPTGHWWLSTLMAALPVVVLLGSLAFGHVKAHYAALLGLATALLIAIFGFHMPARMAGATAVYGAAYGLFPIGWIVLNVIFMYQLTVESGRFNVLQHSMTGITQDRRLQLLLIAFCFGAFFEGAAGFGTPVAVTAALLIGLGFRPLQASGLSLIANTAPVAFGALGTPIIALAKVTGFSEVTLGAMAGRILTPFCILVPFWLIWAFVGWSRHAGDLAGHSGRRRFLRDTAVLHVQPSRPVAGRHCGVGHFDGVPDRLPVHLASQADLDLRGRREPRPSTAPPTAIAAAKSPAPGCRGSFSASSFSVGHADRQESDEHSGKVFTLDGDLEHAAQQDHQSAVPGHGLNNLALRVPPVVAKPTKEPQSSA